MGFRKPMDFNQVHHQIYMTGVEMNDGRNDGYTQFELKKDLYKVKFLLDAMMKDAPTFAGEGEFLEEEAKKVVWRTLTR